MDFLGVSWLLHLSQSMSQQSVVEKQEISNPSPTCWRRLVTVGVVVGLCQLLTLNVQFPFYSVVFGVGQLADLFARVFVWFPVAEIGFPLSSCF